MARDVSDLATGEALGAAELERWIVGAILCDPPSLAEAVDAGLRPEHITGDAERLTLRALLRCDEKGEGFDVPALVDAMLSLSKGRAPFDHAGCAEVLRSCGDAVPTSAYLRAHVRSLRRWCRVRRLVAAVRPVASVCPPSLAEAEAWADGIASKVLSASEPEDNARRVQLSDAVASLVDLRTTGAEVSPGLALPWPSANRLTTLRPGSLTLLAARPGVGKSAAALQIALAASSAAPVLFVSLEMPSDEIAARAISIIGGIDNDAVMGKRPADELERQAMAVAANASTRFPVEVMDAASNTVAGIRARARQKATREGLSLVVVDYLQLLTPENEKRDATRDQDIGTISRGLKALAMELRVPVLALSQLNRASDGAEPQLRHLRESGSLEQDANTVWFLHPQNAAEGADVVDVDLIVAKQRGGRTGRTRLRFRGPFLTFDDLEAPPQRWERREVQTYSADDDTDDTDNAGFGPLNL